MEYSEHGLICGSVQETLRCLKRNFPGILGRPIRRPIEIQPSFRAKGLPSILVISPHFNEEELAKEVAQGFQMSPMRQVLIRYLLASSPEGAESCFKRIRDLGFNGFIYFSALKPVSESCASLYVPSIEEASHVYRSLVSGVIGADVEVRYRH